jgi:hypothetical protein
VCPSQAGVHQLTNSVIRLCVCRPFHSEQQREVRHEGHKQNRKDSATPLGLRRCSSKCGWGDATVLARRVTCGHTTAGCADSGFGDLGCSKHRCNRLRPADSHTGRGDSRRLDATGDGRSGLSAGDGRYVGRDQPQPSDRPWDVRGTSQSFMVHPDVGWVLGMGMSQKPPPVSLTSLGATTTLPVWQLGKASQAVSIRHHDGFVGLRRGVRA